MEPLSEDQQATTNEARQGGLVRPDAGARATPAELPDELLALVTAFLLSLPNAHTRRAYAADLRLWLAWRGRSNASTSTPTPGWLAGWLAYPGARAQPRPAGPGAGERRPAPVDAGRFLRLRHRRVRDSSPVTRVKRPKFPSESTSLGLDREELLRFLAAARERWAAATWLC